jgi:hypothetical protein
MTKEKLREILEAIRDEYQLTEYGKKMLGNSGGSINEHVDCLGNENLVEHLLETELLPDMQTISEEGYRYSSAIGIISEFMGMMDLLRDQCGFFELKGGA